MMSVWTMYVAFPAWNANISWEIAYHLSSGLINMHDLHARNASAD